MATTINTPSAPETQQSNPFASFWARTYTLNWEMIAYVVLFIAAVFTRFYGLGDRVMSHDESLHTRFSYNLYADGDFRHTPLMHGPILFHVTAFMYYIFGDSDFSARIYPAALGVLLVIGFPLLFRRWLGRTGALLVGAMLLLSPLLLYYNRYIRHDTPSIFFGMLMLYSILMYINGGENERHRPRWLVLMSLSMIGNLGSKETSFIYFAIFTSFIVLYTVVRIIQQVFNAPGKTIFYWLIVGILLGGVAALGMYIILDITPLSTVNQLAGQTGWFGSVETRSFLTWTFIVIAAVVAFALGTLLWLLRDTQLGENGSGRTLPRLLTEFLLVALIALVTTLALIVIEEVVHIEASGAEVAQPVVPGEGTSGLAALNIRWTPIIAAWVVGALAVAGLVYSALAGWWRALRRFPEIDILVVIVALVLPWSVGFVIFFAGGTESDYMALGQNIPVWLQNILPGQGLLQDGQFVVGMFAWLPFMVTAIVLGMVWNWRVFLVCFTVFHVIFAFFFTTVFTNVQGLATGMVYSLQYWLEQQEVRRGGQPQYYYLLIIMPIYEFLPVLGSFFAMLTGLGFFWRYRKNRIEAAAGDNLEKQKYDEQAVVGLMTPDGEIAEPLTPAAAPVDLAELIPDSAALDADQRAEDAVAAVRKHSQPAPEVQLQRLPFLLFIAWWAVLNLVGYSLAGEKMPWLGTHLTVPLILLTGWYFGRVFERINWQPFYEKRGWLLLLLLPFMFVVLAQIAAPFAIGQPPFSGLAQEQLSETYGWLALVLIGAGLVYAIARIIENTGFQHLRQMIAVSMFSILLLLTARFAFLASYINYDLATEYLVYAHAAPAVRDVLDDLEEMSLRTTDGLQMVVVYDNEVSWPYSWYFRSFENARYIGANPTVQNIDGAVAIVIGEANRYKLEPLIGDDYYHFTAEDGFIRLWWPMQEYFNLTAPRVLNVFDFSPENTQAPLLRRGIWDIWWNRSYDTYGQAIARDLSVENWPVADRMHLYIRKDIAAQIWSLGVGDGTARVGDLQQADNICLNNWQQLTPIVTFGSAGNAEGQLSRPLDIAVDDRNGLVYIAEENAARISVFTTSGEFVRTLGVPGQLYRAETSPYLGLGNGPETGGVFYRPNSVTVSDDGGLFVVDTWNHRIQRFDPQRSWLLSWGSEGLFGVDIAPQGAPRDPQDGFYGPRDIVLFGGLVYVADTGNNRVRVYDVQGNWVRDIGYSGTGFGQLLEPSSIAIDPNTQQIYVAEWNNRRISVFALDGTYRSTFSFPGWRQPSANRAYMAIDAVRSMLYVTDPDTGMIIVFDTNGNCLGSFGQLRAEGAVGLQFSTIGGITIDAQGFVWVTDAASGQIYRLQPFPRPALPEEQQPAPLEVTEEVTTEATPEAELTVEVTAETSADASSSENTASSEDITPELTAEATPEATPEATAVPNR